MPRLAARHHVENSEFHRQRNDGQIRRKLHVSRPLYNIKSGRFEHSARRQKHGLQFKHSRLHGEEGGAVQMVLNRSPRTALLAEREDRRRLPKLHADFGQHGARQVPHLRNQLVQAFMPTLFRKRTSQTFYLILFVRATKGIIKFAEKKSELRFSYILTC